MSFQIQFAPLHRGGQGAAHRVTGRALQRRGGLPAAAEDVPRRAGRRAAASHPVGRRPPQTGQGALFAALQGTSNGGQRVSNLRP